MAFMKVDDLHVAYLRSQIAGEEQGVLGALNTLDPGQMAPLVTLVHEAFVLAVRTWFGPAFTHGEVIRLVATLRALNSEGPDFVNPAAAESVIRRALGENAPLHADPAARLTAQFVLLDFLVRAMSLDGAGIDRLISDARTRVDQALAD
jgi:hypothetical protein